MYNIVTIFRLSQYQDNIINLILKLYIIVFIIELTAVEEIGEGFGKTWLTSKILN